MARADVGKSFDVDRLDHAARFECARENFEGRLRKYRTEVNDGVSKATIRFVGTVDVHRIAPGHAIKRCGNFHAFGLFKNATDQALHEVDDVFLSYEGGLDVDLRELGLTVRAKVFIAEALGDLEIFFNAADHQQLLVLLRSLWQRVKTAGLQTRWHQEVACAFRSGLRKNRCFDFAKSVLVEEVPCALGHAMACAQVVGHARTADVEVTIFHPQVFVRELLVELEW